MVLMWTVMLIPLGVSLIPSNNPSAWAVIGVPSAWLALYGFLASDGWSRARIGLAALFFVEAVAASGARADAAAYVVIGSLAAIALTWRRSRDYIKSLILPAILALIAGYFMLASGQAAVVSSGFTSGDSTAIGSFQTRTQIGVLVGNISRIPMLWEGAFGSWGLGWLDTPMPELVVIGTLAVAASILFFALGKSLRPRIWVAVAITVLTVAIPLYILQRGLNYVGEQVQPRYIYPLMIVLAGVLLLAFERRDVLLTRVQSVLVAPVLSAAGSMASFINIKRYVMGLRNAATVNLNSNVLWWWDVPFSPAAVWIVGTVSLTLVVIAVMLLARRVVDPAQHAASAR